MSEEGIKARWQKAGFLSKLPMSQSTGEKWQKRFFVAKDGFLLYYAGGSITQSHFDTKPKGIIPLGGCKVEAVERGPKGAKFGIKVTHPDFLSGKLLMLAAESASEQTSWEKALNDCSRVTLENAMLGDHMIEKQRTEMITGQENAEATERLKALQEEALRLKLESEEKIRLLDTSGTLLEQARTADEKIKLMEKQRKELEEKAAAMAAEVEKRSMDHAKITEELASIGEVVEAAPTGPVSGGGPGSLKPSVGMEARARHLEAEKARLESEKLALERQMRDMKLSLTSSEAGRKRLEGQLEVVGKEEGALAKERTLRVDAEKRLAEAELRMKRLSAALERSGTKLDVNVFADVKALMTFFEEQTERATKEAKRTDLTKRALEAKRRYLISKGGGSALDQEIPIEVFIEEALAEEKAVEEKAKKGPSGFKLGGVFGFSSIFSKKKTEDGDDSGDGGGSEDEGSPPTGGGGGSSSTASASASSSSREAPPTATATSGYDTKDDKGPLPTGWVLQWDDADKWYSNAALGKTSWVRPNDDGSVPA